MNIKLLEEKKIKFQIRKYPVELRDTTLVAKFIKVPAGQLFKSLIVVENGTKPLLVMVPSNTRLSLEKLEAELNIQNLSLATKSQTEKFTGMQVGGISPLGLLEMNIPIYIVESVMSFDWIVFSAGQRGVTIQLPVSDFLAITRAHVLPADICFEV